MIITRTFKEWIDNLPHSLKERSNIAKIENKSRQETIKCINNILLELNSYTVDQRNLNAPTLEEFIHWFNSGQLFENFK